MVHRILAATGYKAVGSVTLPSYLVTIERAKGGPPIPLASIFQLAEMSLDERSVTVKRLVTV